MASRCTARTEVALESFVSYIAGFNQMARLNKILHHQTTLKKTGSIEVFVVAVVE